jgi:hypothetical protein
VCATAAASSSCPANAQRNVIWGGGESGVCGRVWWWRRRGRDVNQLESLQLSGSLASDSPVWSKQCTHWCCDVLLLFSPQRSLAACHRGEAEKLSYKQQFTRSRLLLFFPSLNCITALFIVVPLRISTQRHSIMCRRARNRAP